MKHLQNILLVGLLLSGGVTRGIAQDSNGANANNSLEDRLNQINVDAYKDNLSEYIKIKSFDLFAEIIKNKKFAYNNSSTSLQGIIPEQNYYFTYKYSSNNGRDLTDIRLGIHYDNGNSILFTQFTQAQDLTQVELYEGSELRETIFLQKEEAEEVENRYFNNFINAISKAHIKLSSNEEVPSEEYSIEDIAFSLIKESNHYFKTKIDESYRRLRDQGIEDPQNVLKLLSKIHDGMEFMREEDNRTYGLENPKETLIPLLNNHEGNTEYLTAELPQILSTLGYITYELHMQLYDDEPRNSQSRRSNASSEKVVLIYKDQYFAYGVIGNNESEIISPSFDNIEKILDYYNEEAKALDSNAQEYQSYFITLPKSLRGSENAGIEENYQKGSEEIPQNILDFFE